MPKTEQKNCKANRRMLELFFSLLSTTPTVSSGLRHCSLLSTVLSETNCTCHFVGCDSIRPAPAPSVKSSPPLRFDIHYTPSPYAGGASRTSRLSDRSQISRSLGTARWRRRHQSARAQQQHHPEPPPPPKLSGAFRDGPRMHQL